MPKGIVKTLNAFEGQFDTKKMKKPAFRMILTAADPYAYQRKDGIIIVPIGCLKG